MNLDDLKATWRAEISSADSIPHLEVLQSQVARARRDVWLRDFWMIVPLVLVSGGSAFFNGWARDVVSLPSRIEMASIVILTLIVAGALLNARWSKSRDDWTLSARLEREIEMLKRKESVLKNVGYWFLLPMLLSVLVPSMLRHHERTGTYMPGLSLWAFWAGTLVLCGLTYWLCRREARHRFQPLLARLQELQRDLAPSAADSPKQSLPH